MSRDGHGESSLEGVGGDVDLVPSPTEIATLDQVECCGAAVARGSSPSDAPLAAGSLGIPAPVGGMVGGNACVGSGFDPFAGGHDERLRFLTLNLTRGFLQRPVPRPLPWERGFAARFFGYGPAAMGLGHLPPRSPFLVAPPTQQRPVSSASTSKRTVNDMASWRKHARARLNWVGAHKDDDARQRTLSRWVFIVSMNLSSSGLGRSVGDGGP
eukprot:94783-Amphidinium_carterae.1